MFLYSDMAYQDVSCQITYRWWPMSLVVS